MARDIRPPKPIVSKNVSEASGDILLDAIDAGFDIEEIAPDKGPQVRGDFKFDQNALDELVSLSSKGAPIPGQSLTNNPDESYPWEKPATFSNPREALNEITKLVLQPEAMKNVVRALGNGASVGDLATSILYAKFFEGEINPDVMMLLIEPTMYLMMSIGEEANIKYNIDNNDLDELDDEDDNQEKINEFKNVFEKIKNTQQVKSVNSNTSNLPNEVMEQVKNKSSEIKNLLDKGE
tara:strand:- start:5856 stop:6566 length:711 start_codon:yes stop_codon:yes gene_type:complete